MPEIGTNYVPHVPTQMPVEPSYATACLLKKADQLTIANSATLTMPDTVKSMQMLTLNESDDDNDDKK